MNQDKRGWSRRVIWGACLSWGAALAGAQEHPLDRPIKIAEERLNYIRTSVQDYTATLVKRENVGGRLLDYEHMAIKVRNRKEAAGTPFSVYMKFLKPAGKQGREVIYVEGRNNGQLVAHEGGILNLLRVNLDPKGRTAMSGNRHPITELGIENICVKLHDRGKRDRERTQPQVMFHDDSKVSDRPCTMIEVIHPTRTADLDFHRSRVFIDRELQVPVRYAAYAWPATEGAEPEVLEEYTYLNLKLNVGLTERDFDPNNGGYNFP